MTRTRPDQPPPSAGESAATANTRAQLRSETPERRTVLLPAVQEGDTEALLRTLIVIARRLARERQTVVEST